MIREFFEESFVPKKVLSKENELQFPNKVFLFFSGEKGKIASFLFIKEFHGFLKSSPKS